MSATAAAPTTAPAAPKQGLLDRFVDAVENPILLRELRAAFRRKRFVILHTTLLGLVALAQLFAMYVMRDAANIEPAEIGRVTFVAFTAVEAGLVALLFPAFSCTSITEERVTKSYELLITTRLTPRQIIFGKTIAAIIYGFLFIVATSPLVALTFLYGGVSPEQIAITYAGLAVQATLLTVYAVFVSSVSGSTLKAVVFTYLGVALLMPFLLAPLSHMLGVQVFGPLIKDAQLLRQREILRDMDLLNKVLYWGGLASFYTLVVSLFAISATNRIAPPSANRSTPLRLWFLAFTGLATAIALTFLVHDADAVALDVTWALASALGVTLVVFTLAAVAFGGEDTTVARRLWLETRALRGPKRLLEILRPGSVSGGALVIAVLLVVEAALAWVFLDGPLDVLQVQRSANWRPAWQILMWGLAWVTAFVLFVVVLAQRLSLWIQHGLFGRLWTGFVLIGITCYPVFLLYLDPPTAKGRLWHGYYLSPYTVAYSITTQPGLPAVERQLILFGPSGDEIKKERAKAAEAALASPDVQALPRAQQLVAAQRASQARADELVKIGTPVHIVSVWTYLSMAVVLGLLNGWTARRLERQREAAEAAAAKERAERTAAVAPTPAPAPAPDPAPTPAAEAPAATPATAEPAPASEAPVTGS